IQWLRDGLRIIDEAKDAEYFARKAAGRDEVFMVPAFAGLGAPYWDMYARGAIFGLTRDTGKNDLIKATLESLAYQTKDVLQAMQEDAGIQLKTLNVDGGATTNNYLMQFQADLLNVPVERPANVESTAMGAAFLAGITTGIWEPSDIEAVRKIEQRFEPNMPEERRNALYQTWKKAVDCTRGWK
ncbi:MAG: glycerol kinase, partial [Phaeodactylibacter sp.]|nr:glycerol kinase [Phaeodactylibacter sp.]